MRRCFAILLAFVFSLGPLAAALPTNQDAHLPACCRRHGAHHCALSGAAVAAVESGSTPQLLAPITCPYRPGSAALLSSPSHALAVTAVTLPAMLTGTHVPSAASLTLLDSAVAAYSGRGPPQLLSR